MIFLRFSPCEKKQIGRVYPRADHIRCDFDIGGILSVLAHWSLAEMPAEIAEQAAGQGARDRTRHLAPAVSTASDTAMLAVIMGWRLRSDGRAHLRRIQCRTARPSAAI